MFGSLINNEEIIAKPDHFCRRTIKYRIAARDLFSGCRKRKNNEPDGGPARKSA
jgi:hypothetical protein